MNIKVNDTKNLMNWVEYVNLCCDYLIKGPMSSLNCDEIHPGTMFISCLNSCHCIKSP